jgi:DNA polymerase V
MQDDLQTVAGSDGISVHSGFPNPAAEQRHDAPLALDINRLLVSRPSSTYLFRVGGHAWADQGVYDGDVAVVDRALQAGASDLIIAYRGDELVICRQRQLTAEDKPWGVITAIIHQYR